MLRIKVFWDDWLHVFPELIGDLFKFGETEDGKIIYIDNTDQPYLFDQSSGNCLSDLGFSIPLGASSKCLEDFEFLECPPSLPVELSLIRYQISRLNQALGSFSGYYNILLSIRKKNDDRPTYRSLILNKCQFNYSSKNRAFVLYGLTGNMDTLQSTKSIQFQRFINNGKDYSKNVNFFTLNFDESSILNYDIDVFAYPKL